MLGAKPLKKGESLRAWKTVIGFTHEELLKCAHGSALGWLRTTEKYAHEPSLTPGRERTIRSNRRVAPALRMQVSAGADLWRSSTNKNAQIKQRRADT